MSNKQKFIRVILLISIVLISTAMIVGLILEKIWAFYLMAVLGLVGATLSVVNIIKSRKRKDNKKRNG